jgi:hypothetical protein
MRQYKNYNKNNNAIPQRFKKQAKRDHIIHAIGSTRTVKREEFLSLRRKRKRKENKIKEIYNSSCSS